MAPVVRTQAHGDDRLDRAADLLGVEHGGEGRDHPAFAQGPDALEGGGGGHAGAGGQAIVGQAGIGNQRHNQGRIDLIQPR